MDDAVDMNTLKAFLDWVGDRPWYVILGVVGVVGGVSAAMGVPASQKDPDGNDPGNTIAMAVGGAAIGGSVSLAALYGYYRWKVV